MDKKRLNDLPQPGQEYEVPVSGSLGLLALGHRGLLAWRAKKEQVKKEQEQQKTDGKTNR